MRFVTLEFCSPVASSGAGGDGGDSLLPPSAGATAEITHGIPGQGRRETPGVGSCKAKR